MSEVLETTPPPVRRTQPAWHWGTREHLLARIEEKRAVVLAWLGAEIFSTAKVLAQVLGLKKTGTHQTLAAMKRDGLIDFQLVEWHAASIQLVVLTQHGAGIAGEGGEGYQQGKVAASQIGHQLDVQLARLDLERAGWKDWVAERALREACAAEEKDESLPVLQRRWLKVPDGVGLSKTGRTVAIEMERSIKTSKSYMTIAGLYVHMLNRRKVDEEGVEEAGPVVDRVLYITTTDRVRDALHSKFQRIEEINFPDAVARQGNRRRIKTERLPFEKGDKQKFWFASMDDLRKNAPPRHAAETAEEYRERIAREKQQAQPQPNGDA